ncbi:ceramide-1-phosphate transfer protein-like [Latimeria chalumnae]
MQKVNILMHYQRGRRSQEYQTARSMMKFELEHDLIDFKEPPGSGSMPSGSRTFLRLHRALNWLQLLLLKLGSSSGEDSTSAMCAEAYEQALARYHSWFVRQAAAVAFLSMPSRDTLFDILCAQEETQAKLILGRTVKTISRVYNITQELYRAQGLLELP